MIFNIFKGEAKTRNKSRVKETDFLSKLSSVWSTGHFSQRRSSPTELCTLYSAVFTLTEEDSNCGWSHQRKRIVLANFGCDQKGEWWWRTLLCFIHQYNDCSNRQVPQSSGVQRSLVTISIPLSAVSTMSASSEGHYWSPAQVRTERSPADLSTQTFSCC